MVNCVVCTSQVNTRCSNYHAFLVATLNMRFNSWLVYDLPGLNWHAPSLGVVLWLVLFCSVCGFGTDIL